MGLSKKSKKTVSAPVAPKVKNKTNDSDQTPEDVQLNGLRDKEITTKEATSDIANDEKNGSVSAAWAAPKRHKLAVRIMPRTPPMRIRVANRTTTAASRVKKTAWQSNLIC